ncbi:MAG: hypothetical protein K2X31_10650, partial [Sphingopyxis sp.]|nr:hypothetical protein [Sphingopyxis sp.]
LGWEDGLDVPPAPAGERNRVTLEAGSAILIFETPEDWIDIAAEQIGLWRAASPGLTVGVQRVGLYAMSMPAALTIIL